MKLDQIVLVLLGLLALTWVGAMVGGMLSIMPFGLLGLIPIAVVIAIMGRVIYQRLHNAEDDYYDKNVDE